MEAITAVGFAANVLQFVNYAHGLVSDANQAYRSVSGNTARNLELKVVTESLHELSEKLLKAEKDAGDGSTPLSTRICGIATSIQVISRELLAVLDQLRVRDGSHRKWRTFRHALDSIWKRPKIYAMQSQLEELRSQLSIQVVSQISIAQSDLLRVVRKVQDQCDWIAASQTTTVEVDPLVGLLGSLQIESGAVRDPKKLDLELAKLKSCAETTAHLRARVLLLQSLFFPEINARHSSIVDAHGQTFNWILEQPTSAPPSDDPRPRVQFNTWLSQGSGIYWIAGKPGSGKSTLMKYLQSHDRTRQYLSSWATGSKLTVTGYYFWLAGSEMGKSQEGLLRRLLFDILQSHPNWMPTLLPKRWDRIVADKSMRLDLGLADQGWTLADLLMAVSRLDQVVASPTSSTKICIFIDGLDEYYGDHLELIRTIQTIAKVKDIKLCVSSRPWNCFEDAFGADISSKLYLEDLTKDDIATYARDMLHQLQAQYFGNQDPQYLIEELVSEIVSRAQGVFLWVFLVVRSLRDGIVNGDPLTLLQARLRELPTDLEAFFERIIRSVDKVYRQRMANTFQAALNSDFPLRLLLYSFLDEEQGRSPLPHGLRYDDIRHAVASIEEPRMCRSLNGRYKGLLEAIGQPGYKHVNFLHRTVRDFLATRDMQDLLTSYCEADFSPFKQVCKAFILQETCYPGSINLAAIRSSALADQYPYPERMNMEQVNIFLINARPLGNDGVPLIEQMNATIYSKLPAYQDTVLVEDGRAINLFGRAIEYSLSSYVLHQLSTRTKISETEGSAALACSLYPWRDGAVQYGLVNGMARASAEIVSALLNIGASGSWLFEGKPIISLLSEGGSLDGCRKLDPEIRQYWLRICTSLCRHGARIQDCLPGNKLERGYGYGDFDDLVNLLLEWDTQELLGEFLPMLFETERPCKTPGKLAGLVTQELWANLLTHMYISTWSNTTRSPDEDRQDKISFADTANLFLDNGADPCKCLLGQLPHQMRRAFDSIVLSEHPPFREKGYVLVPEALQAIFKERFPERLSVLATLERAAQRRSEQGTDVSHGSRSLKRGYAEMQRLEEEEGRGKRRAEEINGRE
ncbi:hypothetical protein CONLIGDRAFT_391098 [Coniochaeta ligniaria NRRL 30616]|uniref:Uncharacterized protein n=1 Tax=Coniochaeta ligniaria NRRL 30616 TaxID=1408157 RepID=A0A1J7JGC6_9PEZI|nr:hypothetical protein CONLIGDRAFT_391098 [Coniochaeta ligniaria NRRL 30616]